MGIDPTEISLSDSEFNKIKQRVYDVAGISLSDAKRTLVVSRLSKVVRALDLDSFSGYVELLERKKDTKLDQNFVNALTTNLTRFYREDHHFDHLIEYVRGLIASSPRVGPNGKPRLRIWSAGCSTGQEPYTLAMCLMTAFPELKRWDFRILATDIDTNVLAKAALGTYSENDLSGLAPERAKVLENQGDGTVRVPAAMRNLVTFKPLNMIEPWPVNGPFDAIFCRNVAIYFDKPTQGKMFNQFASVLAPAGFLYIGHSENLGTGSVNFSLIGKTIYQTKAMPEVRDVA